MKTAWFVSCHCCHIVLGKCVYKTIDRWGKQYSQDSNFKSVVVHPGNPTAWFGAGKKWFSHFGWWVSITLCDSHPLLNHVKHSQWLQPIAKQFVLHCGTSFQGGPANKAKFIQWKLEAGPPQGKLHSPWVCKETAWKFEALDKNTTDTFNDVVLQIEWKEASSHEGSCSCMETTNTTVEFMVMLKEILVGCSVTCCQQIYPEGFEKCPWTTHFPTPCAPETLASNKTESSNLLFQVFEQTLVGRATGGSFTRTCELSSNYKLTPRQENYMVHICSLALCDKDWHNLKSEDQPHVRIYRFDSLSHWKKGDPMKIALTMSKNGLDHF